MRMPTFLAQHRAAVHASVDAVAAATILGDGRVALILDIDALVAAQRRRGSTRQDLKLAS